MIDRNESIRLNSLKDTRDLFDAVQIKSFYQRWHHLFKNDIIYLKMTSLFKNDIIYLKMELWHWIGQ